MINEIKAFGFFSVEVVVEWVVISHHGRSQQFEI
jgi:hypothetical protein